jgi:hypothetical protein
MAALKFRTDEDDLDHAVKQTVGLFVIFILYILEVLFDCQFFITLTKGRSTKIRKCRAMVEDKITNMEYKIITSPQP